MKTRYKILSILSVSILIISVFYISINPELLTFNSKPVYSSDADNLITGNESFSYNWTLDSRDMFSNTYRKPILEGFNTYKYRLEASEQPLNYQDDSVWSPINTTLEILPQSHPAYDLGYRVYNNKGLYNFYGKPNSQDSYPIAFSYRKSDSPIIHTLRSKLLAVGYMDSSQNYRYEVMQTVQNSQGYIDGDTGIYPDVFVGVDATWRYRNSGMKEDIVLSNQTRTAIENNPPSWGWNADTYLVFATELDYTGLTPYWNGTGWSANITLQEGDIQFRDAGGVVRFSFPIGYVYEQYNESVIQKMLYRLVQYQGNYYLLCGIKIVDLNTMTFPVVFDPSVNYAVGQSSDDCHETTDGTTYSDTATVQYIGENVKYYNSSFRFLDVNIPRNSTITVAYMQLHMKREGGAFIPARFHHYEIHCIDEDNTTTFDTTDRPSSRPYTENKTDWDFTSGRTDISFANRNTVDFSSAVEEVVNRWDNTTKTGWNDTGNALAVVILDDSSQFRVEIHSYDFNGGSNPAELFITYIPPTNVAPNEPDHPGPANNTYPVDRTPTLNITVKDDNVDNLYAYWFDNTSSYGETSPSRPIANGTGWNLSVFPVDEEHYDAVDDIIQNGESDYVYISESDVWVNDTYIMRDINDRTEGINSVTVSAYTRNGQPLNFIFDEENRYKFILFDNNTWNYSPEFFPTTSWNVETYTWTTNPNNESNSWTWDDINNVEVGIELIGDEWGSLEVTQIYATVNYSDPGGKYFTQFYSESGINGSGTNIFAVGTNFLEPYTDYWWYVNVTDGALFNQSETFHLKTGSYSTWTMTPIEGDYNSTSPADVGVELVTLSGLNSDVYVYSWNTTSNDETLLDTLTNVGNGTQTTSWSCGDGTKRYYVYIDTGNFTNTTDITSFFCNDVWSDTFWDSDYINSSTNVDLSDNSFANFTVGVDSASYDSFEVDYGNWTDGSGSVRFGVGHTGSWSIRFDDPGNYFYFDIDATIYSNVSVDFWGFAVDVESDDFLRIEFYDGSDWQLMYREEWDGDESAWLHGGVADTGQKWYVDTDWNWDSSSQIRFILEHASNDVWLIDTVWVNCTAYMDGNLTSTNISLPPNHYWSHFNADVTDRDNVTFSILNATDDSVLISGLDGDNNKIVSLSPTLGENSTIKLFARFTGTVSMDSWNISWTAVETSVDTIVPYNNSNYPLNITATGAQDLENVTLWYRYSQDNITFGDTGYKVQHGVVEMASADLSVNLTIETVDNINNAFVLCYPYTSQIDKIPSASGATPNKLLVTAYLKDANTIEFQKSSTGENLRVDWQVIECFDDEFSVQRGEKTFTTETSQTVTETISTVNASRSMAWHTIRTTYATTTRADAWQFTSNVTDSTTITFSRSETVAITGVFRWIVVIWDTDKLDSFQIGDVTDIDTETDVAPMLVNLGTVIDTSDSILLFQSRSAGTVNKLEASTCAGYIKDEDEVGFYHYSGTANDDTTVHFYVIDFGDECGSKQVNIHDDNVGGWSGETYTLSPAVTLDRALGFVSLSCDDQNFGCVRPKNQVTSSLISTTELVLERNTTGEETEISWQILELPYTAGEDNTTDWIPWNDTSNPDLAYPWSWDFSFPFGVGYYEFYSIGNTTIDIENAPNVADAICYFYPASGSLYEIRILGNTHIRGNTHIGGG